MQTLFSSSLPPVVTTKPDTLPVAQPLAPIVSPDTGRTTAIPAAVDVKKPVAPVKRPAAARTARVELSVPDSVEISVNDLVVGRGKWAGDLPLGRQRFHASIAGDVQACPSLQHDTTVTLSGEKTSQLVLDVASCSVLLLKIVPNDAEFSITSEGFASTPQKARSAGIPIPFVLRSGLYRIRANAERCGMYNDTLRVRRKTVGSLDTIRLNIPLICS
ncbi:MAG: hypothetical protein ABJC26_14380 [Gemmatimonadaceae bacterium]